MASVRRWRSPRTWRRPPSCAGTSRSGRTVACCAARYWARTRGRPRGPAAVADGRSAQEPLVGRVVRPAVPPREVVEDPDAEVGQAVVVVRLEPDVAGLEAEVVDRADPAAAHVVGALPSPVAVEWAAPAEGGHVIRRVAAGAVAVDGAQDHVLAVEVDERARHRVGRGIDVAPVADHRRVAR